jgi:AraC-like DNA-binding protein
LPMTLGAYASRMHFGEACHTIWLAFEHVTIEISVAAWLPMVPPSPDGLVTFGRKERQAPTHKVGSSECVQVVSQVLFEALDKLRGEDRSRDVFMVDSSVARDPAIRSLVQSLVGLDNLDQGNVALYVGAICIAIVARLLSTQKDKHHSLTTRRTTALPKWRLRRVVDYINSHIESCITLADLAGVAGLTRMHFAAQFRLATGMPPHEFVLRRRIQRAQELLRNSNRTLMDIALSVGFQTQAHFTTVFKRFAGDTPHRWRRSVTMCHGSGGLMSSNAEHSGSGGTTVLESKNRREPSAMAG